MFKLGYLALYYCAGLLQEGMFTTYIYFIVFAVVCECEVFMVVTIPCTLAVN